MHTHDGVAQLEVMYLAVSASWPPALNYNPWNFVPLLRENAAEAVLRTPRYACLPSVPLTALTLAPASPNQCPMGMHRINTL